MTASGLAIWRTGWRSFRSGGERLLAPVLAAGLAWVILQTLVQWVLDDAVARTRPCTRHVGDLIEVTHCPAGDAAATTSAVLGTYAFCVLGLLFWFVVLRTVLGERSAPLRAVAFPALSLAVILGSLLTLGIGFGFLPGVVIAMACQFAALAVLTQGRNGPAALLDSVRLTLRRPLPVILFSAIALLVLGAGAALLVVGLWPATVLIALAQVRFRDLSAPIGPA